jgi:ATP-binding cassette subfamily B multidrug efflux pump
MWVTSQLFQYAGTIREGMETLTKPHDVTDAPDAPPLTVTGGAIRFDGVRHHYGREAGGLEGIDLSIAAGERVGLVGRSGAGKSTLVNLLLRFHDPEAGRIEIDGQDVAGVQQESLRQQIAMVTQDTSLLHRSVRDNIRYGRPEASEAEIVAAAKRVSAHDFILELADAAGRTGYDAHVGERGVKLSGGQRQRIALARAVLKDAPILVLDEATSALDSEVEAEIQEALYDLMEGKTVIAIAHRLSTIAQMDRIVVLDRGLIVEQGSHAALLQQGGLYAQFWGRQSGGFIGIEAA